MFSVQVSDVNEALLLVTNHLLEEGIEEDSRAGKVIVAPGPVMVEYTNPRQRVLLSPTRDGNCFFHFFEHLWFMTGTNEIEFPCFFNASYSQFSDDGVTMHDSYGYRWITHFGHNQLEEVIQELRSNPTSRRCVLAMWDGQTPYNNSDPEIPLLSHDDLYVATHGGKAVPCNTHAYVTIRNGKLNLTVLNRSNDLHFGMCGANVVHMSFLLEYLAVRIGVPIGAYFQFSANCHAYLSRFPREKMEAIANECATVGPLPEPGPAITEGFDDDLKLFMPWAMKVIRSTPPPPTWDADVPVPEGTKAALDIPSCNTEFFQDVTVPMFLAWVYRKWKDEYSSQVCLDGIDAPDWHRACSEWVERRRK